MANWAVSDFVYGPGSATEVAALVEAKLEAVDDAKTIHCLQFLQDSRNKDEVVAVLIVQD
jgi:hypothetical protein